MKSNNWLWYAATGLIITVITGLIYVSVQQAYRSGANDPQLQIARDICEQLKKNESIKRLMDGETIEISQSLAIYLLGYYPF